MNCCGSHWAGIQDELIAEIDRDYGVFEGRTFKRERWQRWLIAHGIPWPTTETGQLKLDDDTFRSMAKAYPKCHRCANCAARCPRCGLNDLAVGADGRNRTILSAFQLAHRPLPALQHQVHFRAVSVGCAA